MSDHIQITFSDIQPEQQDWVIAHLAEAGFEGFEEKELELKAYIREENYNKALLKEMAFKYQLSFTEEKIASTNWNAVWESNFHPVVVGDFVAVRADFHNSISHVEHEIIINPKMSFGTGHHATTYLMLQQMRSIQFPGKIVFDFGTGTGVLSIYAEKLGAKKIIAVDIDNWSIENATENIERNKCKRVVLRHADSVQTDEPVDIFLANINRNVLLENIGVIASKVKKGGIILLSGLLEADYTDIVNASKEQLLVLAGKFEKDNWLCLKLVR